MAAPKQTRFWPWFLLRLALIFAVVAIGSCYLGTRAVWLAGIFPIFLVDGFGRWVMSWATSSEA